MRLQLVRGYVWWAAWTSHSRLPGQLTVTPGQLTVLGMGLHRYTYAETGGGCLQSLRVPVILTGCTVDVS